MSTLLLAAKVLSGISLLIVALAVWDIRRRKSFPGLSYGGIALSPGRLRAVWFMILLGGLAFGVNEDPLVRMEQSTENADLVAMAESPRTITIFLPLPFYRLEGYRIVENGDTLEQSMEEGFVLPWPLISVLIAYLVLVVRWNPDSRWARRILEGRRRRWFRFVGGKD